MIVFQLSAESIAAADLPDAGANAGLRFDQPIADALAALLVVALVQVVDVDELAQGAAQRSAMRLNHGASIARLVASTAPVLLSTSISVELVSGASGASSTMRLPSEVIVEP